MKTILTLALAAACVCARAAEPSVVVVAPEGDALAARLLPELARGGYRLVGFRDGELRDPIRRGEVLAHASRAGLVVTVGDAATALVLGELDEARVYFVGASIVPGSRLASPEVAGILAYNVETLLDAVQAAGIKRVAYARTPGYESVAAAARGAAVPRGLTLDEKAAASAREVPAAVGALLENTQALWLAGDPRIERGAGFQFALERSAARRVPLVVSGRWGVERGALLACLPPEQALAAQAAAAIRRLASGAALAEGERIRHAPPGGIILYNAALADKWGIRVPGKWTPLR